MKEFHELSDYPLFYEEIGPKNKSGRQPKGSQNTTKHDQPSLNQQQISMLSKDLQHPLNPSTSRSNQ